jgi:hypothetical protein
VTKLQSFRYEGDCKNFNFDKYVNLHVEQHNQHADLQEYGVAPLAENLRTLWFQEGIRDPSLNAVKASNNANRANFTDFDSVKDAYVEFKRTDNPTNDPKTQQFASVAPRLGNLFGIPWNSTIFLISDLLDSGISIGILFTCS